MATRADHRTGRQKALARTEKAVANANSVVAPRIVRSTTEQQEAFIQHIYDSYAELQRQSEEVNDRKHRIDFDVFQSNQQDVHELLFCNIEIHDTELGDWDTWEKVETVVNKFAYGRPYYEHDAKDSRDEIVCLQERISALNTTVVRQRKKIGVLNENMTATQEELDALRHLLRMKDQEIRALVSKNNTANLQMRAVKRELEVLQGIFSNNGDQQICEDLRLLIEANKALEKENAEMRAKLHAKYGLIPKTPGLEVVEDGESSVAKPTILSLADDMGEDDELQSLNNLLMDDARRMDYIESEIPISGVILQMKKSNLEWMQRLEMEVGNAMAMLDADANAWADHRELNDNFNYPLFDNGDFAAYAYKNALELRVPRNSVVTTVAPGVYRPKGANGRTNSVNSASGVAVGGGVHVASSNNIHGGHHSPVNPLRSWRDEMPRKNLSLESLHQLDRSVLGKSIPESDTTRRGSGDPFARHPSMSHSTDVGGEVASARDGGTFVYGRPIPSVPNVATTPGERSDARMKFLRRFSSYQSIPQVLDAGGSTSETSQHDMPSTHSSAHQPAAGQTLPGPSAGGATWRALRTGVISIAEFSRSEALKREALHINQLRSRIVALNMNVAAISQAAQRNPDVLSKMSEEDHHAMDISQNYPSVVMMMHSLAEAASACTVTVMKDSDQSLAEKSCVEANAFGTSISAPGKPMSAGAAGVAEEEDQDLDEYSQTRNGRSMLETAAPSDRGDATVSIIRDCDPFFSTTDDDAERTKLKLWAYEEGASPYYLTTADIVRLILSRDGADQLREMSNAEIAQHVLNHDCTDLLHGISVTELRDAMIRHGASPSLIDQWGEDGIITAALLNSDRHLMGNIPPEDFVRLLMSGSSTTSACEELLRQHATQLEQEALSKMDAITARFAASLEGKSVAELRTLLIASFQATLSAKFATTQLRAELLQLRRQSHDLKLEVSAFIELMKSLFGAAHRQGRARPAEPEHDPLATMQAMEEELRGVTDDILADMTEKRVLDTLRNNFGIALEEEELSPSMTDENWVAQRLRQVALEVAKNRVVATKRASIRSNERLTKWGNNEPYYLHHLEDESSTVPTLASDQPIMVQGVAHREVRRNDAKRGSDFLRDAEAKARILDQFLHGHGEGGLLPESLFCSEILGAGGAGRGMMMTPDAVQGIAGGGGGGGGGHGGGRLEDAFDARNEDARRRRWPDFIPDDHGTDMDGIPSDFALRGRRIGPEGEIRQIGTKWYYITPVEGPLPPSATPPPSTDVVRHGASRDILAYLRSLRPPPAGGPEGIRPIVYAYKFDKAFSETKRIAQWRLRDGLAKLYGSDFDDIMSLVLPIATAAKNLKSGKGLNAQLVDAIRQLRAEEEARRKHDTRALFRRVATNIRSRLLMKKNVFHGSPFPAFVAVLYDRWRDSMEKQREASRRSQVVHAQRLLDLLGIVQNSATEVERETPTRPLRKPHLPPLSSPARQAISYANAPSSKHFDQAKF